MEAVGLKLNQLDENLRRRIERQMRDEDAATAARRRENNADPQRLPAEVGAQHARPLDEDARRDSQGAPSCEGRYRVRWLLFMCQPMDWDNAAASIKAVQDALVTEGWLPSDDWKTLEGEAVCVKVKHRKQQKTIVEIEKVA